MNRPLRSHPAPRGPQPLPRSLPAPPSVVPSNSPLPPPDQAYIPISQLPLAGPLFGDEQVAVVQYGITCRAMAGTFGGLSIALYSAIRNELLPIVTRNTIPQLIATPDGQMMFLFVNGRAFAEVSGAFTVFQRTINWTSSLFSINPGDEVVACYSYGSFSATGAIEEEVLSISSVNILPPLSHSPNGQSFTLYVEGRPFFLGVASPAFSLVRNVITWISTLYSVQPGDEVVAQYTF
jgi:hypothetical protein